MNQTISWNQNQNSAIVSMGYDNIETNINLSQGHGSIFPDPSVVGPYNIIWWNISDYSNPSNDPFAEVVRCIAKMNDTLIVIRSQQQTLASPKNLYNKLYNVAPLPYNNIEALSYYNLPQPHGASSHTGTIGNHTTNLSNVGSNTHAQIDTALTASAGHIAASGTSVHSLGTMSTQSAGSVTITGGTITGITSIGIGTVSPNAGLEVSSAVGEIGLRLSLPSDNILDVGGWSGGINLHSTQASKHLYIQRNAPTSSNLYLGTAGKELFIEGTTGNVGIGTTNPTVKLDIVGDLTASGIIKAKAGNNYVQLSPGSNDTMFFIVNATTGGKDFMMDSTGNATGAGIGGGKLAIFTGSNYSHFVLDGNTNNVGIGTASPGTKLSVNGDLNLGQGNKIGLNQYNDYPISAGYSIQVVQSGSYPLRITGADDVGTHRPIQFGYYTGDNFANTFNTAVHIDSYSGNVGIGTASPRALLDVTQGTANTAGDSPSAATVTAATQPSSQGTLSLESNSAMGANEGGVLSFKARYLTSETGAAMVASIKGLKENSVSNDLNGLMIFNVRTNGQDGNSAAEKMRIVGSTGNVGIGTASPSVKLTVSNRIGILDGNDFIGTNPGAFTFTSSRAAASPNNFGTNYEQWFIGTGDISGWSGVSDFNIFQLVPGYAYHNRLHIDNTGNVGIGTASPPEKLSINGAINFANQNSDKKLYSPTDGDLEWFTHNSAAGHGLAVSHQGTKYVYLNTSGNSYLNGGYVGIGTASPTAKLHVGGTPGVDGIKFPDGTLQTTAATATPATHNFLRFMNTNLMTDYILGVATITRDMVAGTYTLDVPGGGNGYSIQNYKEVLSSKPRILVFRFTSAYDANWTVNIPAPVIGFGADDNNYIGLQLVNSQWYISAKNAVGYPQMLAISLSAGQLITLCVTNASILCYANGVYKGAVTTKIPTVSLGVWMRIAYGNCGISLDYLTYYSL